jgi:hypothetical protein
MAGEKSTLLSPAVETHAKYLRSVDDRMIDIESRAGRGPFSAQEMGNLMDIIANTVDNYTQAGIVPVFDGPLAKAQRIQQAVEPVISGLQTMAPVFSLFPETKNKIRGSELIDKLAEATNFPMDIINTDEEYAQIVQGINQQVANQQQFQNSLEAAKASKNLQGPVDENSVLSGLAGAMGGQ